MAENPNPTAPPPAALSPGNPAPGAAPPPAGIAQPTAPQAAPQPTEPPPPEFQNGLITEHGIREAIRRGGSVSLYGQMIGSAAHVPAQADLDRTHRQQGGLQQQWAQQQGNLAATAPAPQQSPRGR